MRDEHPTPPRFFDRDTVFTWLRDQGIWFLRLLRYWFLRLTRKQRKALRERREAELHGEGEAGFSLRRVTGDVYHWVIAPGAAFVWWGVRGVVRALFPFPLLGVLVGVAVVVNIFVPVYAFELTNLWSEKSPFFLSQVMEDTDLVWWSVGTGAAMMLTGIILFIELVLVFHRLPRGLAALRTFLWVNLAVLCVFWFVANDGLDALLGADVFKKAEERAAFASTMTPVIWYGVGASLGALCLCALGMVRNRMRKRPAFTDEETLAEAEAKQAPGDAAIEWVRIHSRRRGLLKSWYYICLAFILYSLSIMLSEQFGCVEQYRLKAGDLTQQKVAAKVVKKKKKMLVNPNSPIAMKLPDIDDNPIDFSETNHTYTVGGLKGGKGGTPGVKGALFGDGVVRFIRLQHSGPGWDSGMHDSSDRNMMIKFQEFTGMETRTTPESHRGWKLRLYEKFSAPPFMYVTGTGHIGLSASDKKAIKNYLLNRGGMIFADSAAAGFKRGMQQFAREVLPGKRWIDISNEDELFAEPFPFTDGYPYLWHHTGRRVLGIKHNGRWIVVWHPGELKDAWKTGHMGVSKDVARRSYELGVNIIYYSFKKYALWCQAQQKGAKDADGQGGGGSAIEKFFTFGL